MSGTLSDARPSFFQRAAANKLLLLVVLCGVQLIDAFDVASMGPALPEIGRDLSISPGTLQWVVTAYVLGYGGFLLLGGRLADLFDRRRLLLGALGVFVVASVVGGLSQSSEVLIAARFAKGLTAAVTAPAALAILLALYDDEGERYKALGAYLTVSSVGFTSGLVLGGVMAAGSWRLVLLIPAGLALVLLVVGAALIPRKAKDSKPRERVDLLGAVAVTAGLLALVYGVSRTATDGWGDALTVASLAGAVALLAAFVLVERGRRAPLVPLGIFRKPGVSRGNATIFLLQGAYVGWQFVATLYLQAVNDWTPVEVGLVFAPGGLIVLLTANYWAKLAASRGPWPIASVGMVIMTVGVAWTIALGSVDNLVLFLSASVVSGVGYTMAFTAANVGAVAGAEADEQGLASGLFLASFQIGGGVILGVVASIFGDDLGAGVDAYRSGMLAAAVAAAIGIVVAVTAVTRRRAGAQRSPAIQS